MRSFEERKRLRRFLYSRLTVVLLLILLALLLKGVWVAWERERTIGEERDRTAADLASLQARMSELQINVEELSTDRGTEEELRQKFGAARPGEEVIIIVEDRTPTSSREGGSSGLWSWFRNLF